VGLLLTVALAVYAADVISKIIVVATVRPRQQIELLGSFLQLTLVRNGGAAFSFGTSMTIVFTVIAAGVIIFILRTARRLHSVPWAVTLGLLLGGATGNLTDRLLRSPGVFRGQVVDWIQVPHWPVFNLADSAIVCGGILAVLLAARGIRLDGSREGHDRAELPHPRGASPPRAPRERWGESSPRAPRERWGESPPRAPREPREQAPGPHGPHPPASPEDSRA
jgi:signal peptidase II